MRSARRTFVLPTPSHVDDPRTPVPPPPGSARAQARFWAWVDGTYTGTFWLADVKIIKLNGALVNVIRTSGTDINVTVSGAGHQAYTRGVDFDVVNPAAKNVASAIDLVAAWEAGSSYRITRRPVNA